MNQADILAQTLQINLGLIGVSLFKDFLLFSFRIGAWLILRNP